jgi:hypothetical protein
LLGAGPRPHVPFTVVGGTAVAAAATAVVTAVVPHLHPTPRSSGGGLTLGVSAPAGTASAGAGGPSSGQPGGRRASAAPAHGTASAAPASADATASRDPATLAASRNPAALAATARRTSKPTDPAAAIASGAPATAAATPTGTATSSSGAPVTTGTLSVSPATVLLSPLLGGSLTLTASGGPVSWSVAEPSSLIGELLVTPESGTLNAGESTTVTITVSGLVSLDSQLTVEPGGHVVTVVLGLG